MTDLAVIVPSRGRPQAVARMAEAFESTDARDADVLWALDNDDPRLGEYVSAVEATFGTRHFVEVVDGGGMAHAVNAAARRVVAAVSKRPIAVAVLNDDHVPRTWGWAQTMLDELIDMRTGIVYPDDGLRGRELATCWAMTTDIIEATGRCVPALVRHLYADNAIMDLGNGAGCLRYLSNVLIEHLHPLAGKADWDPGYVVVNSSLRKREDEAAYLRWRRKRMLTQVAQVKELMSNGQADHHSRDGATRRA